MNFGVVLRLTGNWEPKFRKFPQPPEKKLENGAHAYNLALLIETKFFSLFRTNKKINHIQIEKIIGL
jgi:hypothetical protein